MWGPQCPPLWKDGDFLSFASCQNNKGIWWFSYESLDWCACSHLLSFLRAFSLLVSALWETVSFSSSCLLSQTDIPQRGSGSAVLPSCNASWSSQPEFKDGGAASGGSPPFLLVLISPPKPRMFPWHRGNQCLIFKDGETLFWKHRFLPQLPQAPLQKHHDLAESHCMPDET